MPDAGRAEHQIPLDGLRAPHLEPGVVEPSRQVSDRGRRRPAPLAPPPNWEPGQSVHLPVHRHLRSWESKTARHRDSSNPRLRSPSPRRRQQTSNANAITVATGPLMMLRRLIPSQRFPQATPDRVVRLSPPNMSDPREYRSRYTRPAPLRADGRRSGAPAAERMDAVDNLASCPGHRHDTDTSPYRVSTRAPSTAGHRELADGLIEAPFHRRPSQDMLAYHETNHGQVARGTRRQAAPRG